MVQEGEDGDGETQRKSSFSQILDPANGHVLYIHWSSPIRQVIMVVKREMRFDVGKDKDSSLSSYILASLSLSLSARTICFLMHPTKRRLGFNLEGTGVDAADEAGCTASLAPVLLLPDVPPGLSLSTPAKDNGRSKRSLRFVTAAQTYKYRTGP